MGNREFTIRKQRFLDWFYADEFNSEIEEIKKLLAERVIDSLYKGDNFTLTTEDVFNESNTDAIKLYYLEEFAYSTDEHDIELKDFTNNYTLKLIE